MSRTLNPWRMAALIPATLLLACNAAGDDAVAATNASANVAVPAGSQAAKLSAAYDGNWVNISGKVVSTQPSSFVVDYGKGNVTVEMDDWDWYKEGRLLKAGDQVIVSGRVDNDLLLKKRIEAASVYVENLNTYFYANGADEEELAANRVYVAALPAYVDSTGTVTAVEGREFTLGSAAGAIRVDTSMMAQNPLDGEGFQRIKAGDRVYVWGDLDLDSAEGGELKAKGIVSLTRDMSKQSA